MSLQLASEEPPAGPWRVEPLTALVRDVTRGAADGVVSGRPVILAIDGRSNNGKTTLAGRIAGATAGAAVVHTDDISWEHSCFGWSDLLIDGILGPARKGQPVSYRPPSWDKHRRKGSIDVPAGCPLLIIEGDGAGRREVADLIDVVIWVQSDEREVERRRLARDLVLDAIDRRNLPADGSPADHDGWTAEEIPFNTAQRTWERADIFVCGTPETPCNPVTEVAVAPPLKPPEPWRGGSVRG